MAKSEQSEPAVSDDAPQVLPVDPAVPKFRQAVDWCLKKSLLKERCGVCGWEPWPHNKKQSLCRHITRKHRTTVIDLFDKQVMSLDELAPTTQGGDDDELLATAGITRVEDLDRHDYLAIPQAVRERIESDGAKGRWVRADRIEQFRNQGAIVTRATGEHQPSTEDGTLRTNELIHVTLPHELAESRQRLKDSRMDEQLAARGEEADTVRERHEQETYDYLRKNRGLDHTQAKQVAHALEGRRQRETV